MSSWFAVLWWIGSAWGGERLTAVVVVGLLPGVAFLTLAVASSKSGVTLSVFNPWLGRAVRRADHPRTFATLVLAYWLFGGLGIASAIVCAVGF